MSADNPEFNTRFLIREEYSLWDGLVSSVPGASIFSESRWLVAAAEIMACEIKIVAVFSGEHLVGGVAVQLSRRFGMPVAKGIPIAPNNSCVVAPTATACLSKITSRILAITEAIAVFLEGHFAYVVLTQNPTLIDIRSFNWRGWRSQVLYTYHVEIAKADLGRLSSTARKNIKNAEKAGVISALSRDFKLAHLPVASTFARQKAALPMTAEQLSAFAERFGDDLFLLLAKNKDGRVIASEAILLDRPRRVAYRFLAGFDAGCDIRGVPLYLQWQGLLHCRELGMELLDQTGAERKKIASFKAELGGNLVPYFQVAKVRLPYRLMNGLAILGKMLTSFGSSLLHL